MHICVLTGTVTLVTAFMFVVPDPVDGQITRRLRQAATNAAEKEAAAQVERLVRNAIRCAVDDTSAWRKSTNCSTPCSSAIRRSHMCGRRRGSTGSLRALPLTSSWRLADIWE